MSDKDVFTGQIQDKIVKEAKYHINLEQDVIIITEDKLKLNLINFIKCMMDIRIWYSPLSILVTIIIVFVTAEFKDFILNKEVWKAIFSIGLVFFIIYSIITACRAINAKFVKKISIETFLSEMKKETLDLSEIQKPLQDDHKE